MSNTSNIVASKQLLCYTCGQPVKFAGYGSKQRLNMDGTVHKCTEENKQQHQQQSGGSKQHSGRWYSHNARYWRWYWSVGPGARHRRNWDRYSSEDYKQRQKAAEERYKEYRERHRAQESNVMGQAEALQVLELTAEIFKNKFEQRLQIVKQAFRKLAMIWHPDKATLRGVAADVANAMFIKIYNAYLILSTGGQ